MTAEQIAAAFDLGTCHGPMVEVARGWGGLNVVHRLDTARGTWAVKEMVREIDDLHAERLEIEMAAWSGGIPMPRPLQTTGGSVTAELDGTTYRCHEWISGRAKTNEETTADEAGRMGRLVGALHHLDLPWSELYDEGADAEVGPTWAELADAATARNASWAPALRERLGAIEVLAARAQARRRTEAEDHRIGSHRDLNAHNVLFTDGGGRLIDWDAAGPIGPAEERVQCAVLWAARDGGRYDLDAVIAFLNGYREAGGEITDDDPDALDTEVVNVEDWARKNVRWAVESGSPDQDQAAEHLIAALLATPGRIDERRLLLAQAISRM